jgi:hypothetical protein
VGQYADWRLGDDKDQRQGLRPDLEYALETGGILVGEEVTITLDLQFVKS